jgi:hypothetical protein
MSLDVKNGMHRLNNEFDMDWFARVYALQEARIKGLEAVTRSFISTVMTVKRENQPEWMEYLAERINEVCEVIGEEDRVTYNPSHEAILPTKK